DLRNNDDQPVAADTPPNLPRPWHKRQPPRTGSGATTQAQGRPGLAVTTRFDVPARNNGSEHAIRGDKIAAKVSGCWRTLPTLQRHCRIRSYLTSARNHARRPWTPSATPSPATPGCHRPTTRRPPRPPDQSPSPPGRLTGGRAAEPRVAGGRYQSFWAPLTYPGVRVGA